MLRAKHFIAESIARKDWLGIGLAAFASLVIAFAISILFSATTREMALRRFHLSNSSFGQWAAMAPVPAMYNFENRIQFSNRLLNETGSFDQKDSTWFSLQMNHFPARLATFGEMAPRCFSEQRQGTLEMTSRFRETLLTSRWEIRPDSDYTMHVHRQTESWVHDHVKE